MKEDSPLVAARRIRLREWIDNKHEGVQADFIAATGGGVNQGELSGLLRNKSFGEKRAESLEIIAQMPEGYLVRALEPVKDNRQPATLADALLRLRQAEDGINALTFTLAATLRAVAGQDPALGRSLEQILGALQGDSGSERQVTEAAVAAVAAGLQSWESAGRRASPP